MGKGADDAVQAAWFDVDGVPPLAFSHEEILRVALQEVEGISCATNDQVFFQRTMDKFHDRYIILDYKLRSEKMYNCGSSPKDSGRAVTSITKSTLKMAYHPMVDTLLNHPPYVLK